MIHIDCCVSTFQLIDLEVKWFFVPESWARLRLCPRAASQRSVRCASGRGRDRHFWSPPAQIRTCGVTAYGSHLGCLARKRTRGCGCTNHGDPLLARGARQSIRRSGSDSGAWQFVPRFPWSMAFPPPPSHRWVARVVRRVMCNRTAE